MSQSSVVGHDRYERHLMRQRGAGPRNITATFGFSFDFPAASPASNRFGDGNTPVTKRRRIDEVPATVEEASRNGLAAIPGRAAVNDGVTYTAEYEATIERLEAAARALPTPPSTAEQRPAPTAGEVVVEKVTTATATKTKTSKSRKRKLLDEPLEARIDMKGKRKPNDEPTKIASGIEPAGVDDVAALDPLRSCERRKLPADDENEVALATKTRPINGGDDSFVAVARSTRPRAKKSAPVVSTLHPDTGESAKEALVTGKVARKAKPAAGSSVPRRIAESRSNTSKPARKQHSSDRLVADGAVSEDELSSSLVAPPAAGTTADLAAVTSIDVQEPSSPARKARARRQAATTGTRTSCAGKRKALVAEDERNAQSALKPLPGRDGGGLAPDIAANSHTRHHGADDAAPATAPKPKKWKTATRRSKTAPTGQKRKAGSESNTQEASRSGREILVRAVSNDAARLPAVLSAATKPSSSSPMGKALASGRSKRAIKAGGTGIVQSPEDAAVRSSPNAVVGVGTEMLSAVDRSSVKAKPETLAGGSHSKRAVPTKCNGSAAEKSPALGTASPGLLTQVDEDELSLSHAATDVAQPKDTTAAKRAEPKAAKPEIQAMVKGKEMNKAQKKPAVLRNNELHPETTSPCRRPLQEADVNVVRKSVSPEKLWQASPAEHEVGGKTKPARTTTRRGLKANIGEPPVLESDDASVRPTGTAVEIEAKTNKKKSKPPRLVEAENRDDDARIAVDEDVDWLFAAPPFAAAKAGPALVKRCAKTFTKLTDVDLDDLVMNIASIAPVTRSASETPGVPKPAAKTTRRRK